MRFFATRRMIRKRTLDSGESRNDNGKEHDMLCPDFDYSRLGMSLKVSPSPICSYSTPLWRRLA
jgi:hypothetical protein